jgi:serine/threonine protein phosphatase PrpC
MEAERRRRARAIRARMRRAIELANEKINVQSRINQNERGMGTTCTAVGLADRNLLVGQIGDSRCYVLARKDNSCRSPKTNRLAWQLIEAGAMTVEEAKSFEHANIILQALGVQEKVDVVLSSVPLCRGDVVLVSSDGLHGPVADDEMRDILLAEPDPKKACEALIGKALEREGPDNISVVVARFEGDGLPEPQKRAHSWVSKRTIPDGSRRSRAAPPHLRHGDGKDHGRAARPRGRYRSHDQGRDAHQLEQPDRVDARDEHRAAGVGRAGVAALP